MVLYHNFLLNTLLEGVYETFTVLNFFFPDGYNIRWVKDVKIRNYDTWVKIGLNILHYRKERSLTQEELADLCGSTGVSRNHIQRVETAAAGCSVDVLIEIAKALNVPLYKLFEFKD